jgi:diguanylate cyclase (GGDEF)-like protein
LQGTVVICRDITARKEAQSALEDSERLIRSLVEHSSNGILRFARDELQPDRYRCTFANSAAERFLPVDGNSLVGTPLEKLTVLQPRKLLSVFGGDRRAADLCANFEIETEMDDGATWMRMVCESVGSDFSVTLIDITARKQNENKILADAMRDPLTGVFNRRGFEQLASERLANCEMGAVFYLDLNHFKSVNDRFGHRAGDALLKAFGHRLEFCLRPEDILARVGGDEFVIVLPDVSVAEAKVVAERLIETASEAYIIQGQEIDCSASVGIAFTPQHGDDLWHLVSVADEAMYNAKAIGSGMAANDRSAYIEAAISS